MRIHTDVTQCMQHGRQYSVRQLLFMAGLGLVCLQLLACTKITASPESATTLSYWTIARGYQAEGRHELAKQYFTLALAGARSGMSQAELQQEIEVSNRMLQAMR